MRPGQHVRVGRVEVPATTNGCVIAGVVVAFSVLPAAATTSAFRGAGVVAIADLAPGGWRVGLVRATLKLRDSPADGSSQLALDRARDRMGDVAQGSSNDRKLAANGQ